MITMTKTTDLICSCSSCGIANYQRDHAQPEGPNMFKPSGAQMFDMTVMYVHGDSKTITRLCVDCVRVLRGETEGK